MKRASAALAPLLAVMVLGFAAIARADLASTTAVRLTRADPVVPIAIDEAGAAGIAQTSITMGAVVTDVNGDGLPDFLLNHHGTAPAQLYTNDGDGTFSLDQTSSFALEGERLGCDGADVDGDGQADFFCAQGGSHGTGIKRDELWIQGSGLTFSDQASARGVADPFGRGRLAVFLDANLDGLPDLYVANQPTRSDGLPSPSRFFLNEGGGVFRDAPSFGLDLGILTEPLGTGCLRVIDVNADGFPDLLICGADHLHLLINQGGTGFVDATAQYLLTRERPNDAILTDVDSDGVPDLVEVKKTQVLVRLQHGGVFRAPAFKQSLVAGAGIAAGDVNGDGTPDLYVVQGRQGPTNAPDLVLLNASQPGAVSFVQMASIPQAAAGSGQWVYPLDYDGNGLTDFLVTNGQNLAGPLQLIAFFPAGRSGSTVALATAAFGAAGASSSEPATPAAGGAVCGPSFTTVAPAYPNRSMTPRVNALTGASSDAWAAGTLGGNTPLLDHWDGSTWSYVSIPPLGTESGVMGAGRIAPDDAWIVGYQGNVDKKETATEHWDGTSWTLEPSADPGPDGNLLTDVATATDAPLFSVGHQLTGASFQPLIERWDALGGTWAQVPAAAGYWEQAALMSVVVTSANQAWAFGWSELAGSFQGLIESWNGVSWSVVAAPQVPGADSSLLLSASPDGAGGLWAVGYSAAGSRYQSLAEHYDGASWTIVPTVDPSETATVLRSVTAVSPNDVWAVGFDQDQTGLYDPLLEHWNGTSWSTFVGATLSPGDAPLGAVASFSGSDVWAAGEGAKMEHLCPFVVSDTGITPSAGAVGLGQSVLWQIPSSDAQSHSVTDASGLGLYDSGLLPPGSTYVTSYAGSGGYLVTDTTTGAETEANVALTASPTTVPVGTPVTIQWATADAPAGFEYDVQVKTPGSGTWITWFTGTAASSTYVVTQTGTYGFRARFGNTLTNAFTLYGPATTAKST